MKRTGYTIIEIITVLAILIIVSTVLLTSFISSNKSFLNQTAQSALQTSVSTAMERIVRDIRGARQVLVSYDVPPTYTTATQSAVLQVPALDSNGQVVNGVYDTFIFALIGSNFSRIIVASPQSSRTTTTSTVLADGAVTFSYYDQSGTVITTAANYPQTARVTIALERSQTVRGHVNTVRLEGYGALRNR
jgi:type II secretory pathway pseudopilin PulG